MSIAREYNELSTKTRFICSHTGEVIARVEPEVERDSPDYGSFVFQWIHEDRRLEPDEAIALAAWINEVFGSGKGA